MSHILVLRFWRLLQIFVFKWVQRWTIPSLLYQIRRKNPLVYKGKKRSTEPLAQILNNFTKSFTPQVALLRLTKWLPERKIQKSIYNISWGWMTMISQLFSWCRHRQFCTDSSVLLNKMVKRAESREVFKQHLLPCWTKIKIISYTFSP